VVEKKPKLKGTWIFQKLQQLGGKKKHSIKVIKSKK
jgi:hypothetical protein